MVVIDISTGGHPGAPAAFCQPWPRTSDCDRIQNYFNIFFCVKNISNDFSTWGK